MRGIANLAASVWLIMLLSACQSNDPDLRAEFFVFGTLVEVIIRDADYSDATEAFAQIQTTLQGMHKDLHAWEPGELTQLNQSIAQQRAAPVSDDIETLIRYSQQAEHHSQGYFNAAAGGLVQLWGFHTSTYPVLEPIPEQGQIQAWLDSAPASVQVSFDNDLVVSENPAVQFDFGGIAKGFAVDRVIDLLSERGFDDVLVNAGGDLRVSLNDESEAWNIGISNSRGGAIGGLMVSQSMAVFTSGSGERFGEDGEQRYAHILNPLTGRSAEGLVSATVISELGWYADASATALVAAGSHWQSVAHSLDLERVLIIDEQGEIWVSAQMAEIFVPQAGISQLVNVIDFLRP